MRWTELVRLPVENIESDPLYNWALDPRYFRIEEDSGYDTLRWSVTVLHRHWDNGVGDPDRDPSNFPPKAYPCKLENRDEVFKHDAFPAYRCAKCGERVPNRVVVAVVERRKALKGVDPRNDRRGAVLATRKANS